MIFYYMYYYFTFILIFLLCLVTIFNRSYICYKNLHAFFNKSNYIKLFLYCFALSLFFMLFNIVYINDSNLYTYNIVIIYKIFLLIFSLFYLFILKFFCYLSKFFTFESIWILMFSFFCLFLLIETNNFLYFYLIIEGYSLSIISFIGLKKFSKKLLSASFNYLILNIIVSCLILYSISLIYFYTGILNFSDLNNFNAFYGYDKIYYLNISYSILIVCFFVKLAVFPFSLYIIEIYNNLPFVFTLYFLLIPKFCFTVFLFNNLLNNLNFINTIFIYLIILTSAIHSVLSIKKLNFKNLIINTSFSNIIFLLSPLFCKNVFIINGFFNFIFIYFFNLICLFSLLYIILNNFEFVHKRLLNMYGLIKNNAYLSLIIIFFFVSLSSLPPFSGFFAKLYILYFFIEYKMYFVYFIVSFSNLFIIYSYLKNFKNIFLIKKNFYIKNFVSKKKLYLFYFVSILCIINLVFIFFFDFFFKIMFILMHIFILV